MKAIILLLLISFNLHAQPDKGTLKYMDYKYGFRDVKFEMELDSFPSENMIFQYIDKGQKIYKRNNDILKIGDIDIKDIQYVFYQNKLMGIIITIDGILDRDNILEILNEMYGHGDKPTDDELYFWTGKKATCLYNEMNDEIIISITSNKLMTEFEDQQNIKSKNKAESDF